MNETKKINKKLRRVMSMSISLDAAIRETMVAMVDDDGDFIDQSNDETAYYEMSSLHGQLVEFMDILGDICKNRLQNQRNNETKAQG
nr:MAG TPA: hypothetical protein [Caudoviricetes sp.]